MTDPVARKRRRPHPARATRIATGGISVAAMFGIVGAMGWQQRAAAGIPAESPPPTAPRIVVVVHRVPAGSPAATAAGSPAVTAQAAAPPIALAPQPVVARAPSTATPVAKTRGSR